MDQAAERELTRFLFCSSEWRDRAGAPAQFRVKLNSSSESPSHCSGTTLLWAAAIAPTRSGGNLQERKGWKL